MSRAPVRPPDNAFGQLSKLSAGLYEAHRPALIPVAAAFLFLPGLAAEILLGAAGVAPDSPVRAAALVPLFMLLALGQGALTLIALGIPATVRDALIAAQLRLGRVLIVGVLSSAAIALGFLALIVPGLYLFARLAPAIPALLAEDLTPTDALTRAWELTRGAEWRVAGFLGLLSLVAAVILLIALLASQGLQAAGARAGAVGLARFAALAIEQWAGASASATIVLAQVAVYRWLRADVRR